MIGLSTVAQGLRNMEALLLLRDVFQILWNSSLYSGQLEGVIERGVGEGFYGLGLWVAHNTSTHISLVRTL